MIPTSSKHLRQGVDYEETANVRNLHAFIEPGKGDPRIRIQPFSLWILVFFGLMIFVVGFCSARYDSNLNEAIVNLGNPPQSQPNVSSVQATAVRSPVAETNAPAVLHVVMRNMKFDPSTLEVKVGDTVEWKNEDITPHTATSATFDSASIDPDQTWRHTFTESGNFPYTCTFHPQMKAAVLVK